MIVEKVTPQTEFAMLQEAFHRFSTTGQILQEKYDQLKVEVVDLRAALKQKETEMKRHERLAMLGKTAAAIAHEIRNPLGAIKLFLSMLQEDLSGNADSQKVLDHIHASIERLDGTVSNILQFAKDMKLDFSPVNISSLIQEQIGHFQASEPETLHFDVDLKGPAFIAGNEDALRRSIFNLFLNAVQVMKQKGKISVRTRESADGGLELSVRDTGPGIPEEIRESLFEPFVTTRNAGTGLGLAIVRQVIEQHGGSVTVGAGAGAEFIIKLPKMAAI